MKRKQLLAAYETARKAELSARERRNAAEAAAWRASVTWLETSRRLALAFKKLEGRE